MFHNTASETSPNKPQTFPPAPGSTQPHIQQNSAHLLNQFSRGNTHSYPAPGNTQPHPAPSNTQPFPAPGNTHSYPAPTHGHHEGLSKHAMMSTDDPVPSAPPLTDMDKLQGYENVSYKTVTAPPPAYQELPEADQMNRGIAADVPAITEEQVREALFHHVSEHCCFGKSPAKEMVFSGLEGSSAFHYNLKTFTEQRETNWTFEPFKGQPIDSFHNGRSPLPWEITVVAPSYFTESKTEVEVPHSASVKDCHACFAHGCQRCSACQGFGNSDCRSCGGRGRIGSGDISDNQCLACSGRGRKECLKCSGQGKVLCRTCDGTGSLKCFIRLTVTWVVHSDDYIVERTGLPDKLIKAVGGRVAFEEEYARVAPVRHFPEQSINKASSDIIKKHTNNYPLERILIQKQQIRIIPVIQVAYNWNDKNGEFYVYGFEQKVYAPDYPQQCCWGCNIL